MVSGVQLKCKMYKTDRMAHGHIGWNNNTVDLLMGSTDHSARVTFLSGWVSSSDARARRRNASGILRLV